MNFLLYTDMCEFDGFSDFIKSVIPDVQLCCCNDENSYWDCIKSFIPDVVIVSLDGAGGMEAVISVKRQFPQIPVMWFSDDLDFAVQAYRLDVAYFHKKPITSEIVSQALNKCKF